MLYLNYLILYGSSSCSLALVGTICSFIKNACLELRRVFLFFVVEYGEGVMDYSDGCKLQIMESRLWTIGSEGRAMN